MKLTMYQVDAFAERLFEGNPAAVCPLQSWLSDALMGAIAEENNLSETAFFVLAEDGFALRWFTPGGEVDLCGHATLATASVLYEQLGYPQPEIHFHTRSGLLVVARAGDALRMTFPATRLEPCATPQALAVGLGMSPVETLAGFDYIAIYPTEEAILALAPDFATLEKLPLRGVVATAPGREVDFVSRFFCPKMRINEDPVTGSAHCELAPYWSERLGRTLLTAFQLSRRGGSLTCEVQGENVLLTGRAQLYMTAEITVPER